MAKNSFSMYLHMHTCKVNAQNSERKIKKIGVNSNSQLTTRRFSKYSNFMCLYYWANLSPNRASHSFTILKSDIQTLFWKFERKVLFRVKHFHSMAIWSLLCTELLHPVLFCTELLYLVFSNVLRVDPVCK